MRLELVLVGLLILSPLTGCLSGGEDLDQTNTSRADPPTGENLSSEEAGENATANTSGPDEPANDTTEPETAPEHSPENPPTAVVALIDRGINPYHEAFRDDSPLAHVHPSTYIEGFPEDAEALNLTLEADSYAAALEADREVWANVSDGELYWIPGTRIVGAISLEDGGSREGREETPILDDHGHGTMTASRAAGEGTSLAPGARIVAVEGFGGAQVRWTAEQDWIDVQSNSWIDRVPPPANQFQSEVPETELESTSEAMAAAADEMVTVAASGNGLAYTLGLAPTPTFALATAPDGVILAGAHDNGYLAPWSGSPPHVVADGFRPLAAVFDTMDAVEPHAYSCCTSASAPYAAGGVASLITEARALLGDRSVGIHNGTVAEGQAPGIEAGPLADGELTREELREVFLTTAQARPTATFHDGETHWAARPADDEPADPTDPGENAYCPGCWSSPVRYSEIPGDVPTYAYTGYGAINAVSDQQATAILLGAGELPDRAEADRYYEADQTARETYYP
jgi:hypothetical protein